MTHGPTRIASKGACIYCGRSDVTLTDEHIVPLSLGGHHVIEKGSCEACANITTRFERDVGRDLWGDARIAYDAPSRRRKKRKTHIDLRDPIDPAQRLRVPYNEYPAPMVFYRMHKAGLLQGFPVDLDISDKWQMVSVTDETKLQAFSVKHPGKLTAKLRHVPKSFARLIAKIGYGQILCSLDPGDFRPICLPYILDETPNASFMVGGRFSITDPEPGFGYVLKTAGFGSPERLMLVAEVRLIAHNCTPTYHALVGDVIGRESVAVVTRKLDVSDAEVLPLRLANPSEQSDDAHWLPDVWPLPFWMK